ncbi:MAG TPA: hypothetical protein VN911_07090 [Candidatus Acidoferrum sp.]|nr:hypothetical protein [Candidatus Acidoferrum sp.]
MSVRNAIVVLLSTFALLFLAGCGSNGATITNPVAPPSGAFSASTLNGTYVFSVSGTDFAGAPLAIVGTLTANGSGGITGGAVDISDAQITPLANVSVGSGSYNVGVDGRGRATLNLSNSRFASTLMLDFVLSSSSHGLVIELDGNGSGSGTLDLQTAGVTPTGTYAFSLSGANFSGSPWATVGNFAISGTSLTGLDDLNEGGLVAFSDPLSGTFQLGPSSTPGTTLSAGSFNGTFDVFAIDATHLKFIEMDSTAILSGDAFSQTSTALPTGTLAFTLGGDLGSNPFSAGGFMTMNGSSVTGSEDDVVGTTVSSSNAPGTFGATFTAAGIGRFTLGSFTTFVGGTTYAAYPSSGGLLLLEIDSGTTTGITTGAAYTQTSPLPAFASGQGYGMNLSGVFLGSATFPASEVDDIAEFTANNGTLTAGIIDENSPGAPSPIFDVGLVNGTYGTIDSNGRYFVQAQAGQTNSSNTTSNGGFALTLYTVDGMTFPFIEVDGGQVATGVVVLQNSSAANPALAHAQMFVPQPFIHAHVARQKKN